jgi:hypothetical protein
MLVIVSPRDALEIKTGENLVGEIDTGSASRTATVTGDASGDWLCAWCLNRVANEEHRFAYEGKDEFTFCNPEGIRFEIITFTETAGCREVGVPTLEHTWFPGHAWSFCQCDRCGHHLGWYYAGPQQFVGLIKSRILRALGIRN